MNQLPAQATSHPSMSHPHPEIEIRLGMLRTNDNYPPRRISSPYAPQANDPNTGTQQPAARLCSKETDGDYTFHAGVSRSDFNGVTTAGNRETRPIGLALGLKRDYPDRAVKQAIVESHIQETAYFTANTPDRVVFQGNHHISGSSHANAPTILENKRTIMRQDVNLLDKPYDMRMSYSLETQTPTSMKVPPADANLRRIKQRTRFSRTDQPSDWRIDLTRVTTGQKTPTTNAGQWRNTVHYELEIEMRQSAVARLQGASTPQAIDAITTKLSDSLWHAVNQLNPSTLSAPSQLAVQPHPNRTAVVAALAHCEALGRHTKHPNGTFISPLASTHAASHPPPARSFPGALPINFGRSHLETLLEQPASQYFLSEKTDGERYLLVFTHNTAVLVNRKMQGMQPVTEPITGTPTTDAADDDPFADYAAYIKPGTVLDGELVMNHHSSPKIGSAPTFVVFDILATDASTPVTHQPYQARLEHLNNGAFCMANEEALTPKTMTNEKAMAHKKAIAKEIFNDFPTTRNTQGIALKLKQVYRRDQVNALTARLFEDEGRHWYRDTNEQYHGTDGIIFHPNTPYTSGTDRQLLKWKYADHTSIDVALKPHSTPIHSRNNGNTQPTLAGYAQGDDTLQRIMPTVELNPFDRMRFEADHHASQCAIAEISRDTNVGEWHYHGLRTDKATPNHIGTVFSTIADSIGPVPLAELQYRLALPSGIPDTYQRDARSMIRQFNDHMAHENKRQKLETRN